MKQVYKKSLFFNGKTVYDYVYNNTKVKNIVFGYFLSPSEKFYGQLNDAGINVYYSDITLNFFNPKITIKKDEKDNQGNYIRRERYSGSCQRSFYVGEGVKQEDLKAAFNNGILTVAVPKEAQKQLKKNSILLLNSDFLK